MTSLPPPRAGGDDLVPSDDAVIGRAFRWSALAIVLAAAAIGLVVWMRLSRGEGAPRVVAKQVGEVADLARSEALPAVPFTDVTATAGVRFVHESGARGERMLPETMGGGVAFLDHDGDGDQDLLFVGSAPWPWDRSSARSSSLALYANDGRGRFEDVTRAAGLEATLYGMGAAAGDYDNDGDPDLFVTALGRNRLYRNTRGRFEDVTARAGVRGKDDRWSTSAGFFDADNDGDLDLFVCNYVRWSRDIDFQLAFTLNGRDRAYGPPTNYEGVHPYLYRNDGNGTFTDVSASAGVEVLNPATRKPMAKALGVVFADVDRDGRIDVLVANDTVQKFLFRNRGDGTFEELGAESGFGFDAQGAVTGAMGIDAALYRDADDLGVAVANFANEMSSLHVTHGGRLQFVDESASEGIGAPTRSSLGFGLFFFDADLDGRLDLFQANGHLEPEIREVQASQEYRQPAQLFWNAGPGGRACFAELPRASTGDLAVPRVSRGAAYADVDGDGDLDLALAQTGGPGVVLRNDQETGHAWIRVRLEGTRSNRDGIGAWVEIESGGRTQRRQVMPTRSYLSQVELPLTFGLGAEGRVDRLRVRWPAGGEQVVEAPPTRQELRIVEPR